MLILDTVTFISFVQWVYRICLKSNRQSFVRSMLSPSSALLYSRKDIEENDEELEKKAADKKEKKKEKKDLVKLIKKLIKDALGKAAEKKDSAVVPDGTSSSSGHDQGTPVVPQTDTGLSILFQTPKTTPRRP